MANPDNNMNAGNNYSNNIEFNVGNGDYVQQNRERTTINSMEITEITPQSNLFVTIDAASGTAIDNQFTDAIETAIDNSNVGRTGSVAVIHNAEQHLNTFNLVQLIDQYNRQQGYQSLDQLRYIEIRNRLRQLERRLQRRITNLSRKFRNMRSQLQNEISRLNQHHQTYQH
ncbi:hypothetical protein GJ496_001070 [Pomphorhynchus laevis]|nr:hypothetical protein GJ496_001070 [Pomphorhynchus laevis]